MQCDLCAQEPAAVIVGDIETGQQTMIGQGCLPGWCLATAEESIGLEDMSRVILNRIAALQPPAPEDKPARRRGKRPSLQVVEQDPTEPAPAPAGEAPAASTDG